MSAVRIGIGTELSIKDKIFAVRQNLGNGILQLEAKMDGELQRIPRITLANALVVGDAQIHSIKNKIVSSPKADLSALPQKDQKEVMRRWEYIKLVEFPQIAETGKKLVKAVIPLAAEKMGDVNPPSWQQLYRWLKLYRDGGCDICALIPKTKKRGNRRSKLPIEVHQSIQEIIKERFLITTRPRVSDVYSAVIVDIKRQNQMRPEWEQLPTPNIRTLYREIAKLDKYTFLEGRYGKAIAQKETRHIGKGAESTRPLERIEIDHTVMDIMVVAAENEKIVYGRPTLTMVIDHFTRMPLGYYVGFEPPSTASVMMALRNAFSPKDWVNERYPDIKGKWPCYGVPEMLVTDNGAEFHSNDLDLACAQLGILIQHNKVKSPWTKGTVERFLGEISRSLLSQAPGKTFHKVDARAEYKSVEEAIISLEKLDEVICQWIVDVHAVQMHEGINAIPLERWEEGVEIFPPRLFSSSEDLDILLAGNQPQRRLHPQGIVFNRLRYNSPELSVMRNSLPQGVKVDFKFDHMDLGQIYVLDPRTEEYLPVPALEQDYAKGLGYWQHKVVSRYYRELREAGIDTQTLAEAKESIHRKIRETSEKTGKKRTQKRLGRFNEADGSKSSDARVLSNPIIPEERQKVPTLIADWQFEDFDDEDDDDFLTHDMQRVQNAVREEKYD
ncbi:MAG: DDE-type integrase/transposase/recombinase [Methylocystaceae bacterium]|nr:DDE-type integrase/transposase/recombinase [Methylocystaceae bacterium]